VTYDYRITAVDLQGLESEFSSLLRVAVPESQRPRETVFMPASLPSGQPGFEETFLGIGLLNLSDNPDQISLTGVDSQGAATGYQVADQLLPHGRCAHPPDELAAAPAQTIGILSQASCDIHPFFLAGTKDLKSFEGMTEALKPGKTLYFPITVSETGSSVLGLFNPQEKKEARVELTAWTPEGTLAGTTTVALPPFGAAQHALREFFGENFQLKEGYLKAVSTEPVEGYEISSFDAQSLSALPAQSTERGHRLTLPHFFFDDSGGETEIRLINTDEREVEVTFSISVDGSQKPQSSTLRVPALAQAMVQVRTLLGRQGKAGVVTGHLEVTGTRTENGERLYGKVIAEATFVGNGGTARTSVPLRREGTDTWIFPMVMQSREAGLTTGLALLNQKDQTIALTIRALDDQGNITAERAIELPAGQRLVGLLDTDLFFGPDFAQTGGHLEVTGDRSFLAMAIFGDVLVEFLSHIGPVER